MKKNLTLLALVFNVCLYAQPAAIDLSFNYGTGVTGAVFSAMQQSNGKIILTGGFTSYFGYASSSVARVNIDGNPDTAFHMSPVAGGTVNSSALQNDGKIIIGGIFLDYNGTVRNKIARLNTDGSVDVAFNPGTGANGDVYTTALQGDGKIIIGGDFTTYNGTARNRIARLNTDGSLDATFNPGAGADAIVRAAKLQSDGKVIIVGYFSTYNGTARNCIARLNTNGTLDATFNPGTGANDLVEDVALQSDGKIIMSGFFSAYNGTTRNYIARVNTDGTLDATFNPGTGANNYIQSIALQNNGKILIGGNFTTYGGTPRNYVARLNTSGTLDTTFNPGTGANGDVYIAGIQTDGKIIIGGTFTAYNGYARKGVARLLGDSGTGVGIQGISETELSLRLYPNPANSTIVVGNILPGTPIVITNLLGEAVIKLYAEHEKEVIDISRLATGTYFLNNHNFVKQ